MLILSRYHCRSRLLLPNFWALVTLLARVIANTISMETRSAGVWALNKNSWFANCFVIMVVLLLTLILLIVGYELVRRYLSLEYTPCFLTSFWLARCTWFAGGNSLFIFFNMRIDLASFTSGDLWITYGQIIVRNSLTIKLIVTHRR